MGGKFEFKVQKIFLGIRGQKEEKGLPCVEVSSPFLEECKWEAG